MRLSKSILLLGVLASLSYGAVVCALDGSTTWALTVGEAMTRVTCTGLLGNNAINPPLPTGLSMDRQGRISGTPTVSQGDVVYTITTSRQSQTDTGTITISIMGVPTKISCGITAQDVYKDLTMLPIYFKGDTVLTRFTISPPLGNGLTFDTEKGIISGKYTGGSSSASTHIISGSNDLGGPVSTTLTLYYYEDTKNEKGFAACYYNQFTGVTHKSEEWYRTNAASYCAVLRSIDCTDNYMEEEDHSWPDLDDRVEVAFAASITGYIHIGVAGKYTFSLTASDGAAIYFNDADTPLITFDGESSSVRTRTAPIDLTAGKHFIRLYFINGQNIARLKLEYECADAMLPKTVVDEIVGYVGGSAPHSLTYKTIATFVQGPIDVYRPPHSGSPITAWQATPTLPNGLSINPGNGAITGTPTTAQATTTYTISVTGPLGSTSTTVTISVGAAPRDGLLTRFYFFRQTQGICQTGTFPSNNLRLQVETIETQINHPLASSGTAWDGIPGDIFYTFYVVWTGYIRFESSGDYVFKLSNQAGARLIINQDTVINSWGCPTSYTDTEGTFASNGAGYAKFEVQFFSNNSDFGVELAYKLPGEDLFNVVPADKLYHIPDEPFTYSTQRTRYYRGIPIRAMTPVLYGLTTTNPKYTISPETLPAGLTLNESTGVISGTATEDLEDTTYTVTCAYNGSLTVTTQIQFSVTYVEPPSAVKLTVGDDDVSSVTVDQMSQISSIRLSATGTVRSWKTIPALPSGLAITSNRGVTSITGRPIQRSPSTTYSVTAVNEGGSAAALLVIEVVGCQYNNFFYSSLSWQSRATFSMSKPDGTVVIEETTIQTMNYGISFCEPLATYNYNFTCTTNNAPCTFRILRDDGLTFVSLRSTVADGKVSGSLSTVIQEAPTISASETAMTVALRQPFEIQIETHGIHHPITFDPELPKTVSFDSTTMTLAGAFTTKQTFTTTASVRNDKGTASVTITIDVDTCPDNKNLITFSRSDSRTSESMTVMFGTETVLDVEFIGEPYSKTMCLANGEYTVTMRTTSPQGGWTIGQELLVKDTWDDLLTSLILSAGERTEDVSFSIAYVIMDVMPIKYLNAAGAPPKGWNTVNFNDKSWKENIVDEFGDFAATTVYFRKDFQVDNRYKYVLFEFELQMVDGAVAYINGVEVARRNMPDGVVDQNTAATGRYDELLWYRTGMPTSVLVNGKNVLAVELHKGPTTPAHIQFDMYGTLLHGVCMFRGDRGTATGSDHTYHPEYRPRNAFDSVGESVWRDSTMPVWLQWTYNDYRYEFINTIFISSSNQYNRQQVKKFQLIGYVDEDHQTELLAVDNRNIFRSSYQRVSFTLENPGTYPAYRLNVEETNNGANTVVVSELSLYSCNVVYCPKEGSWRSIQTETQTYGVCPSNTVGESIRKCGRAGEFEPKWGSIDYTYCKALNPGSGEAFIDMKYMVTNSTLSYFGRWVRQGFISEVRENLAAKSENVELYLVKECNDSELENVCLYIRVKVDSRVADYAFDQVPVMQKSITMNMHRKHRVSETVYFIAVTQPRMTKYQLVSPVVIVVIVIVVIVAILLAFGYVNKNKKAKSSAVRGHKSKTDKEAKKKEKSGLLGGDKEEV